jgi:hypothetical protein
MLSRKIFRGHSRAPAIRKRILAQALAATFIDPAIKTLPPCPILFRVLLGIWVGKCALFTARINSAVPHPLKNCAAARATAVRPVMVREEKFSAHQKD